MTSTSGENDSARIEAAAASVGALTANPAALRPASFVRRRRMSSIARSTLGANCEFGSIVCRPDQSLFRCERDIGHQEPQLKPILRIPCQYGLVVRLR